MSTHITMLTTSRPGPALSTLNLARGVPVVLAEHGLPDLLTYTFSAPVAFESEEALAEFLDVVCDQTIEAGLFKPHTGRRGRTPKLTIDGAGWHMSGIAELRLNAQHRGHVHFSVNLNPTRWIAALPHSRV